MDLQKELFSAVKRGDLFKLAVLNNFNFPIDREWTLQLAAAEGQLEIVQFLSRQGTNIDGNKNRALRKAASIGHIGVSEYLLKYGADIHSEGDNALTSAILTHRIEAASWCLKHNAKVCGNFFLPLVAKHLRGESVKILLLHS